jgi:hypothetical protein
MSVNTYQKIPTGRHNTTYGHHSDIKKDKKCCAKGCAKLGRLLLKINYVNKTGYFCDSCAQDLLQQALAVEIEGV